MNEVELERMVVRIVGEDSSFQKMMDRAVASGQKMERMAQQSSKAEDKLNEALRQGAEITKASETATEKYNRTLQKMTDLYNTVDLATGRRAVSQETFNRVMTDAAQMLPAFAEATRKAEEAERDRQDVMRRGSGLTQAMQTDAEKYAARLTDLNNLLKQSAIDQRTYNRARAQLKEMPGSPGYEKRQAQEEGQRIVARLPVSDEEKYNRVLQEMTALHKRGGLTLQEFDSVMKAHEYLLPQVAAAMEDQAKRSAKAAELVVKGERDKARAIQEAAQVARSVRSPEEDFRATQGRLRGLVADGGLSMDDYNKAVAMARQQLPEEQKKQQSKATGEQFNQDALTNRERYVQRAAQLNALLASNDITAVTHAQMTSQLTAQSYQDIGNAVTSTGAKIAIAGGMITGSLVMLGRSAIAQAKDFEQTMVSFEAMLGSQKQAQKMLSDLTTFAANTPFTMPTLLSATKMLLQFKVASKDVVGILKSIGDVTGGADAGKVQSMAYAFAQMNAAGKLMGQDLMQMINAGFNPLNEMTKMTGKSMAELREEMSEGRISADMVKDAFSSASERLNLMGTMSQTVEGRISTLTDNISLFWRSIGQELLPVVGMGVDALASITGWFQRLSPGVKQAAAYAGLFAVAAGTAITATAGLVTTIGVLIPVVATAGTGWITLATQMGIYTSAEVTAAAATNASTISQLKAIATKVAYAPIALLVASSLATQTAVTASLTAATWGLVSAETAAIVTTTLLMTVATGGLALIAGMVALALATNDYNKELERAVELNNKLKDRGERHVSKTIREGNTLEGTAKTDFFKKEVEMAKQAENQTIESVRNAEQAVKTSAATWKSLWMSGWFSSASSIATENMSEVKAAAERAKIVSEKLRDAQLNAGGTAAIEAEFNATSKTLDGYEKELSKASAAVNHYKSLRNPSAEATQGFEKSKTSVKDLADAIATAKSRMEELQKMKDAGMTVEAQKMLTDFKKNQKLTGNALNDAMVNARLFDTGTRQETRDQFASKFTANEAQMKGIEASKNIEAENKKYEEQLPLINKVGHVRKMAELDILVAQAMAMNGVQENTRLFEQISIRRQQLAKEETLAISEIIKKREQENALIGLKGVALQDAQQRQQGFRPMDQEEKDRAGEALNKGEIDKFVSEMNDQSGALKLTGFDLELYKMRMKGVGQQVELTAEQINTARTVFEQHRTATADKSARDQLKSLTEQGYAIQMNSRDAEIYLEMQKHVSRELAEQLVNQKHDNEDNKLVKSLQEQITMLRMTAEEAEKYKLKLSGMSDAMIEVVTQLTKQKRQLEQWKALTEKHMSPQMKMDKQRKELEQMFALSDKGPQALRTYQQELLEIQKQADKTGGAIKGMASIDAVGAGTADAVSRINEYLSLRGGMDLAAPKPMDLLKPDSPDIKKAGENFAESAWMKLLGLSGEQFKMEVVPEELKPVVKQPGFVLGQNEAKLVKEANSDPESRMGTTLNTLTSELNSVVVVPPEIAATNSEQLQIPLESRTDLPIASQQADEAAQQVPSDTLDPVISSQVVEDHLSAIIAQEKYRTAVIDQLMSAADEKNNWTQEGVEKTHDETFKGDTAAFATYARQVLADTVETRQQATQVVQDVDPKTGDLSIPYQDVDLSLDKLRLAANNIAEMKPEQFKQIQPFDFSQFLHPSAPSLNPGIDPALAELMHRNAVNPMTPLQDPSEPAPQQEERMVLQEQKSKSRTDNEQDFGALVTNLMQLVSLTQQLVDKDQVVFEGAGFRE